MDDIFAILMHVRHSILTVLQIQVTYLVNLIAYACMDNCLRILEWLQVLRKLT